MQFSTLLIASLFATALAAPYSGHHDDTNIKTGDNLGKGDKNTDSTGQCSGDRVVSCCNSISQSENESEVGKGLLGALTIGADGVLQGLFQCSQFNPQIPVGILGGAGALQSSKSQQCATPNACCQGDRDTNTGLIVINPKLQCNTLQVL
ncbi:hypothetical protein EX30DRAFT_348410 [Ascodesmis nigricans]|uniref:Hydrophobin n=1 Tax=Ascodesmis nigricans TaxID=341454 RepID=A0A4S2MXW9_9PEZI|nr:hypothetical protein EX30DRAFT_348410 [Ascodesmis nigricans]